MRRIPLVLATAALVLIAVVASACGDGGEANDSAPDPKATPGRVSEASPIDEVELIIRESFPPQYAVRIVSGLPSGCAEFEKAELTGTSGTTFTIAVTHTTIDDPNAVCTAIYGMHESTVELGSDLVSGTEYTVNVNDESLTFTAQ
jgi:hypothetical protein